MISELSSVTSDLVRSVLDVSLLRHKVISNNVANHNTQSFNPQKVEFESMLAAELAESGAINDDVRLKEALDFVKAHVVERDDSILAGSTERTIDIEMAEMAENTLRYEALIRGLGKLSEITTMAITGGRR